MDVDAVDTDAGQIEQRVEHRQRRSERVGDAGLSAAGSGVELVDPELRTVRVGSRDRLGNGLRQPLRRGRRQKARQRRVAVGAGRRAMVVGGTGGRSPRAAEASRSAAWAAPPSIRSIPSPGRRAAGSAGRGRTARTRGRRTHAVGRPPAQHRGPGGGAVPAAEAVGLRLVAELERVHRTRPVRRVAERRLDRRHRGRRARRASRRHGPPRSRRCRWPRCSTSRPPLGRRPQRPSRTRWTRRWHCSGSSTRPRRRARESITVSTTRGSEPRAGRPGGEKRSWPGTVRGMDALAPIPGRRDTAAPDAVAFGSGAG